LGDQEAAGVEQGKDAAEERGVVLDPVKGGSAED
jgi:hypothetical protein